MNRLIVEAASFIQEQFPKKKKDYFAGSIKKNKKLDYKVNDVALEKVLSQEEGSLFVSALAPQVVLHIISEWPFQQKIKKQPSFHLTKRSYPSKHAYKAPVGIRLETATNWLNAIMQFIIFIPSLTEMFNFVPKSLCVFAEFIDQYLKDASQNKITTASTALLFERLKLKFPQARCFNGWSWDLPIRFIRLMMRLVIENYPNHFLPFLEEIDVSLEKNLEEVIQENIDPKLLGFFSELFICRKDFSSHFMKPIQKQLFFSHSLYLKLDSFIEYRPDGADHGSYLTYVKLKNTWYQCDDHRISQLAPSTLPIAMQRGILFHYKHIRLAKTYDPSLLTREI